MQEQAVDLLKQLGFSSYEARAYIGLLECQPVGAYELAKKTQIPSSKIYETVTKLLNREIIQFAESDVADNPTYVALPAEDLTERLNQQITQKTSDLLPLLQPLQQNNSPELIWPINELQTLKDKTLGIVASAADNILVSCWPEELEWLKPALEKAEAAGLKIALVHFGKPECSIGATYHHPAEKTLYSEKGGRGLTLVTDSRQVVMANLRADGPIDACWSKNAAFVTVAEDYIKHDVYITKVTRDLGQEVIARYGNEYEKLRNIFDPEA